MPVGRKTGGRTKGTPNKVTAAKAAEVAASGLTPLDYLLKVMRDEGNTQEQRVDAAKSAAPYCHARLSTVDASLTGKLDLVGRIVWQPPA